MLFPLARTPFSVYPEITWPVLGQLKHPQLLSLTASNSFLKPLFFVVLYMIIWTVSLTIPGNRLFFLHCIHNAQEQAHSRMSVTTGEKHEQFKWGRVRELLCNIGEYIKQGLKRIKLLTLPKPIIFICIRSVYSRSGNRILLSGLTAHA